MKKIQLLFAILCFVIITSIASCKKDKSENIMIHDDPKLLRFLSITLQVPSTEIKIDEQNNEFYIPNTLFKIKIEDAKKHYAIANEYKANYEK